MSNIQSSVRRFFRLPKITLLSIFPFIIPGMFVMKSLKRETRNFHCLSSTVLAPIFASDCVLQAFTNSPRILIAKTAEMYYPGCHPS